MKLIRFGPAGAEKPGLLIDGCRRDASAVCADYNEAFFAGDGMERLRAWVAAGGAAAAPVVGEGERWGAPVARPSKIVCVGLNYRAHAEETGAAIPSEPVLFQKASSAWNGPHDPILLPPGSTKLDWEVELAMVIGRRATRVSEADAMAHVAGFAVMNDVSERAWQKEHGGQWNKGKSGDTFAPFGPLLVTPDEAGNPDALRLTLQVNGRVRQDSSTADLIFPVRFLVSYISRFMTLLPGDVISTGTPSGVGMGCVPPEFLKAGDVVTCTVEGLGEQRSPVVAVE